MYFFYHKEHNLFNSRFRLRASEFCPIVVNGLEFEELGMGVEEGFGVVVLRAFINSVAVALLDDLTKMHDG